MFGKNKQQEQNLANQEMQNQDTSSFDGVGYENGTGYENTQQNNYYYDQNNVEPLSGEGLVEQNVDPNAIVFVPGQNGVPANITQQGLDNLVRVERLYRNGVVGEQAYYNLQQKIFNTFLG